MSRFDIFYSLGFGLVFILEAIFLIHSTWVKWYLIGMGQIMVGVGLIGLVPTRKKEVKGDEG